MNLTRKINWPLILSGMVFSLALCLGYFFACQKSLENDELYSHVSSIEGRSYGQILTMRISEGNVSPLFYLSQKIFFDFVHFRLPFVWNGDWFVKDLPSQIIMRFLPNVCMSFSVTIVFYFFARFYSLWTGFYSLLIAISSYMILAYWAVARPYALWNFLTMAQILLFLYLLRGGEKERRAWQLLLSTHILLSLTVVFSAVQIATVSLVLFLCKDQKLQRYLFLTVLPIVLCGIYYFGAPKYSFYFIDTPVQLISASFPKERLALFLLLGGIFSFIALRKQIRKGISREILQDFKISYFLFACLMFVLTAALLLLFVIKAHGKQEGFSLSNRYFIYLAPLGIVGITLFSVEAYRMLSGKLQLQWLLLSFLGGLLVFRMLWGWQLIRGYYQL
jgi:hypothetical protein